MCYSDYLPLVKSFRQPRAQVLATSNMTDLWVRIWAALDDRSPGRIEILWTKSHSTAQQRAQHAIDSDEHFLNWCADFFAGWAAREGGPTSEQVDLTSFVDRIASAVLDRLLAIHREVVQENPRRVADRVGRAAPLPPALPSYRVRKERLRAAGHDPVRCGVCLKCSNCARRFPMTGRVSAFCPGPCMGSPFLSSDPLHHPLYPKCAGGHILRVFRGVLYCEKCGRHATVKVRGLANPCLPEGVPPSKAGKDVLSRLSRGLPPISGGCFPQV